MSSFKDIEGFFADDGGLNVYTSEHCPHRKKTVRVFDASVDWPALIGQLMTVTGMSFDDLAEITGFGSSYLRAVFNESSPCETADKTIKLIGLYIKNVNKTIPKLGDDNKF